MACLRRRRVEERAHLHPQDVRDPSQVPERYVHFARLDSAHVPVIHSQPDRELFLGDAAFFTQLRDASADLPEKSFPLDACRHRAPMPR